MPPGNAEAMAHYEDTIHRKVALDDVARLLPFELRNRLKTIFGAHRVAVWGSSSGPGNRSKFERMAEGDDLLIVEGDTVKLIGKIAAKLVSPELSRELWHPLNAHADTRWELIYFIANPRELDVPFSEFCKLFGYSTGYQLRGFTSVSEEKLAEFYDRYDDLYSVLVRLKSGETPARKRHQIALTAATSEPTHVELQREDIEQVLQSSVVSDHVKMQWKLACLGIKAGERVWIPVGDQAKLRKVYEFEEFDKEFIAGIDLPHSYVENIDVVWKQEFRIDAAYEIENSTAIYSGLLRFADLMILAPNTIYPMFIVAPAGRKNQVREQLRRPTFKDMQLAKKVRFLSYEVIDEVERFFGGSTAGLNVDLIAGKAELVD
jgi:hypothetical protein